MASTPAAVIASRVRAASPATSSASATLAASAAANATGECGARDERVGERGVRGVTSRCQNSCADVQLHQRDLEGVEHEGVDRGGVEDDKGDVSPGHGVAQRQDDDAAEHPLDQLTMPARCVRTMPKLQACKSAASACGCTPRAIDAIGEQRQRFCPPEFWPRTTGARGRSGRSGRPTPAAPRDHARSRSSHVAIVQGGVRLPSSLAQPAFAATKVRQKPLPPHSLISSTPAQPLKRVSPLRLSHAPIIMQIGLVGARRGGGTSETLTRATRASRCRRPSHWHVDPPSCIRCTADPKRRRRSCARRKPWPCRPEAAHCRHHLMRQVRYRGPTHLARLRALHSSRPTARSRTKEGAREKSPASVAQEEVARVEARRAQ